MKTADFDYHLPKELIAQEPLVKRDASRLLVLNRATGQIEHRHFSDIGDYFAPGDILVANNSRVIPARLYGRKTKTGGRVEILLLEQIANGTWQGMVGGKRVREGTQIRLEDKAGNETDIVATIINELDGAQREIEFDRPIVALLDQLGHTPLPPYIQQSVADSERYQTVYSRPPGSAAAPTAGLHFTPDLLLSLREKGVLFETVTLHVGLDTFKPVTETEIEAHTIHSEWATLTPETAQRINEAKLAGGRIVAVGTTSVRVLETAALRSAGITGSLQTISQRDFAGETTNSCPWRPVAAFEGRSDLFIYPGYHFRAVDRLITNFHLPQSTLMMLVSAFADKELIMKAYEAAIQEKYRFYSFGDAMLIL